MSFYWSKSLHSSQFFFFFWGRRKVHEFLPPLLEHLSSILPLLRFGDVSLSVFHIRTSREQVGVHEFTFWFRLLPLMGSLSALMEGRSGIPGGLGAEKRGGAPDRTAAVSPSVGPAQLAAGRALLPLHFGYSSLPFGLISLDLVNYRSSSGCCRAVLQDTSLDTLLPFLAVLHIVNKWTFSPASLVRNSKCKSQCTCHQKDRAGQLVFWGCEDVWRCEDGQDESEDCPLEACRRSAFRAVPLLWQHCSWSWLYKWLELHTYSPSFAHISPLAVFMLWRIMAALPYCSSLVQRKHRKWRFPIEERDAFLAWIFFLFCAALLKNSGGWHKHKSFGRSFPEKGRTVWWHMWKWVESRIKPWGKICLHPGLTKVYHWAANRLN